jgi:hypothetical protein
MKKIYKYHLLQEVRVIRFLVLIGQYAFIFMTLHEAFLRDDSVTVVVQ